MVLVVSIITAISNYSVNDENNNENGKKHRNDNKTKIPRGNATIITTNVSPHFFLLSVFFYSNTQVYLLGYGAKLFRFNFETSNPHGDSRQDVDVSSAESITGHKSNDIFIAKYLSAESTNQYLRKRWRLKFCV